MNWKVILEKDKQSGWFTVTVPSLPGCISQGKSKKDALKNIREAIELHMESLAEDGIPIIKSENEIATVAVKL
ncbi:MAG TPA: type II toxin-antitoxin system HicB family antitoxin [archaeon]|nr:type II toxin-antitoxin system HicB family antitoxin [archaeon]